MGLNTLRTKFSIVLTALLAVALLSFIISADTVMSLFNSNAEPTVLKINGEEVKYNDYAEAHSDARACEELMCTLQSMMYNYRMSPSEERIAENTNENLIIEHLYKPVLAKLGITASEAEVNEAIRNFFPDATFLDWFVAQTDNDANAQYQYEALRRVMELQVLKKKYDVLAAEGAYANSLELVGGMAKKNNIYSGRLLTYKYSDVDSLPAVTDAEIEAYYDHHRAEYAQTPRKTLKYVEFNIEPSEADHAATKAVVDAAYAEFAAATDLDNLSLSGVNVAKSNSYKALTSFEGEELAAMKNNKAFGPELEGNAWRASRRVSLINAPEKLELSVAVLFPMANADSLATAASAKGADFETVVKSSMMPNTSVETSEHDIEMLPVELADIVRVARKGDVKKFEMNTPNGPITYLVKVVNSSSAKKQYVRTVEFSCPVRPSQETINAFEAEAKAFSLAANGSLENFDAALKKDSLTTYNTSTMRVDNGKRTISGFANATDVARWVDGAGVGSVSGVLRRNGGLSLVVAVVSGVDGAYKPLALVKQNIRQRLIDNKRFDLIREKAQGATIEEVAAALGKKVQVFKDVKIGSLQGVYNEERVNGALAAATEESKGKLSSLIEGNRAAYMLVIDDIKVETDSTKVQTIDAERIKIDSEKKEAYNDNISDAIKKHASVEDYSLKFF